jgi:peptidylprolyl isomerase
VKSVVHISFCLALVVSGALVGSAEIIPEKTRRALLVAQDLRDAKAIAKFLLDKNPEVKARAALACGSLQDTTLTPRLLALLSDSHFNVRASAAFALGQLNYVIDSMQRALVSQALTKRLSIEQSRIVALSVVEALGKVGDEWSLSTLAAAGESSPYEGVKYAAALSVGRYAYRNIKNKTATQFAARILDATDHGEEWKAAYALMRIADSTLLAPHLEIILRAAAGANADVRVFIATALGRSGSGREVTNGLLSLALSDADWRVRVNAIRGLVRVPPSTHARVLPAMFPLIADLNEHISLTTLATLGDMNLSKSSFAVECRKALVETMNDPKYSQRQKKEAAVALGKLLREEAFPILNSQFVSGNISKESFAASLATVPTRDALQRLNRFATDSNVVLHRIALESMLNASKTAHRDSDLVEMAKPMLLAGLKEKDMTLIATAAGAVADSVFADDESAAQLLAALKRLKSPRDTEAMQSVIQALGMLKASIAIAPLESLLNDPDHVVGSEAAAALKKITGNSYDRFLKPHSTPTHKNFDWKLLERIKRNPLVNVATSQGTFTFKLLPDESPFTCINFATLIKKKFFDGRSFHRVVPNFVIQGGDPRGDGWGGPGYSIRSEFGNEHYEAGMVGVASSGKDTEGCQWFVTHSKTPHLDGRYTIFGRIVSGMEVVNRIQVGDKIARMRLGISQ